MLLDHRIAAVDPVGCLFIRVVKPHVELAEEVREAKVALHPCNTTCDDD